MQFSNIIDGLSAPQPLTDPQTLSPWALCRGSGSAAAWGCSVPVTEPGEPPSCSQVQGAPTVAAQGLNIALEKQAFGKVQQV